MSDSKAWNLSKKTDSERIEELAREIGAIKVELQKERADKEVIIECLTDVLTELGDCVERDSWVDPLRYIYTKLGKISP